MSTLFHSILYFFFIFGLSHFNSLFANSNTLNTCIPIFKKDIDEIKVSFPRDNSEIYQTIPCFYWSSDIRNMSIFEGVFEIEIDDNDDFSSPEDTDKIPSFINFYSPDFELDFNTPYYWRVRYSEGLDKNKWSDASTFIIKQPNVIIDVLETDGWDEIRTKWQRVLNESTTAKGAVELRFPPKAILNVKQDSKSDESYRSNGFLLYIDGYDNIIVNGRGSKIILEATHDEWLCGFMEVNNSKGVQLKNIIIDYKKNSLLQIGGKIFNFNKNNRTFDVYVDTLVYDTKVLQQYNRGYFLSKDCQQRIGLKGVHFKMEETWEEAKINSSHYRFTCGKSEYGRYKNQLKNGDYFVNSERSGDIVYLKKNVSNFVVNNITTCGARGRFLAVQKGCEYIRNINNNFLRTQGRLMGTSSGGVGSDRGKNSWHENNRFEYTRDDMFHPGSNAGKGMVFRRNSLIGAFRNSIWIQGDRTWVSENKIDYAGSAGIQIGYAPSKPATLPDTVLVEQNVIRKPNWDGIRVRTNVKNPDLETNNIYNKNLCIRNNFISDVMRGAGIYVSYLHNGLIKGNTVTSTINNWSIYAKEELQKGIYISNSENISGCENQILDKRIEDKDYLFLDTNTKDISLCMPVTEKLAF